MQPVILKLFCLVLLWGLTAPALAQEPTPSDHPTAGRVKSLEERVQQLEQAIGRTPESGKWYDRIQMGGRIEVEAAHTKTDYNDPAVADEKSSDVDLASAELVADAKIADHIDGHVLIKFEDDELFVDEGFIALTGSDSFPAYLIAGRQYIPFGNFDSHFITDPNTLLLGETNEGALVAGYRLGGEMVDISMGVFNGRAKGTGDDDAIDSFVAGIAARPVKTLLCGVSYTSNLGGSDAFNEFLVDADNLDSQVGGWSAFASLQFLERFKLIVEYVAALDSFKAGEVYDSNDTIARQPSAWNLELGAALAEGFEIAARYGGSDDGGPDFLPETQFGAVLNWGVFVNTNLAIEYLHDEFEDDIRKTDTLTAQLAIEF